MDKTDIIQICLFFAVVAAIVGFLVWVVSGDIKRDEMQESCFKKGGMLVMPSGSGTFICINRNIEVL